MIFKKKPCGECFAFFECLKNGSFDKCEAYKEWVWYIRYTRSGRIYDKWLWLRYHMRRWAEWFKECPLVG